MNHQSITRIINILKDCEPPVYERNKKQWNVNKKIAIINLQLEMNKAKLDHQRVEVRRLKEHLK